MRHELRWCHICGRVEEVRAHRAVLVPLGEGRIADRLLALAPWIAEALVEVRGRS